jgi:hypothetical protein
MRHKSSRQRQRQHNSDVLKDVLDVLQVCAIHVHLCGGKGELRPGRITVLEYSINGAEKLARLVLSKLRL